MNEAALDTLIETLMARRTKFKGGLSEMDALIDELSPVAARGFLHKLELCKICTRKSPRKANFADRNSEQAVKDVTELAFRLDDEGVRIGVLASLNGVSIPTASAILAWTHPKRWGVIDRRAWSALYDAEVVNIREEGTGLRPEDWVDYVKIINRVAAALDCTPQRADVMLYLHDKFPPADA